jgi:hypothetical protein
MSAQNELLPEVHPVPATIGMTTLRATQISMQAAVQLEMLYRKLVTYLANNMASTHGRYRRTLDRD